MKRYHAARKINVARIALSAYVRAGETIYTVTRNETPKARSVSAFVVRDGQLIRLDPWIAGLTGWTIDNLRGGVRVPIDERLSDRITAECECNVTEVRL